MPNHPDEPSPYEKAKRRREDRDELRNWIALAGTLIPVFAAALGFSPLTKIWSAVFLVVALVLVLAGAWWHHRGGTFGGRSPMAGAAPTVAHRGRHFYARWAAIIGLIFGAGAWVGSSGRDTFLYVRYGTLGDLAITAPSRVSDPAVIAVRRDGDRTCFTTKIVFNIQNATAGDVLVGLISQTLTVSDDTNAPIFVKVNRQDVTSTNAGVSSITLIKGATESLPKWIEDNKNQLTMIRRNGNANVTITQDRYGWADTCLPDKDGTVFKNYKGSTVSVAGDLVMTTVGEGGWTREPFDITEAARIEK